MNNGCFSYCICPTTPGDGVGTCRRGLRSFELRKDQCWNAGALVGRAPVRPQPHFCCAVPLGGASRHVSVALAVCGMHRARTRPSPCGVGRSRRVARSRRVRWPRRRSLCQVRVRARAAVVARLCNGHVRPGLLARARPHRRGRFEPPAPRPLLRFFGIGLLLNPRAIVQCAGPQKASAATTPLNSSC